MTQETIIKKQIKGYLKFKHIFWWYNLAGIGSQKGIPDMFALSQGRIYAIEVKKPTGRLSEHQAEFLNEFREHGGVVIVARSLEDVTKYL